MDIGAELQMRNRNRGQGLTLLTLAALTLIAGVSIWLLISEKPQETKVERPGAHQVDGR